MFTHADTALFPQRVATFAEFLPQVPRLCFAGESGSIGPLANHAGPIEPAQLKGAGSIGPRNEKFGPIGPIEAKISNKYLELLKNDPLLIERQRALIVELKQEIQMIQSLLLGDVAILSTEVSRVGQKLSDLIGIVSPDDVLHNIFNNFCIGK